MPAVFPSSVKHTQKTISYGLSFALLGLFTFSIFPVLSILPIFTILSIFTFALVICRSDLLVPCF